MLGIVVEFAVWAVRARAVLSIRRTIRRRLLACLRSHFTCLRPGIGLDAFNREVGRRTWPIGLEQGRGMETEIVTRVQEEMCRHAVCPIFADPPGVQKAHDDGDTLVVEFVELIVPSTWTRSGCWAGRSPNLA